MSSDPGTDDPATELTLLRTELNRLATRVARLEAAVTAAVELASAIDQLGARVEQLADQRDPGRAGRVSPVPDPAPVAWVEVAPDRAPAVLVELAEWLSAVLAHHRVVGYLQPCWYRHPGLVQLLLDARTAWLAAYRTPSAGRPLAALDWSGRHLPHLEQRVRELMGRCSSVRHEPPAESVPVTREADLRAYAHRWAASRTP